MTFEAIGQALGRDEVAIAAIFYGQAMATQEDIEKLAKVLEIPIHHISSQLSGFPDRGRSMEMPPKDPTIYRLYEVVQNYGQAYKAVLNEKFGDGIMSAISFSTKVEKETDDKGDWAVITLRGKWYGAPVILWIGLTVYQAPVFPILNLASLLEMVSIQVRTNTLYLTDLSCDLTRSWTS